MIAVGLVLLILALVGAGTLYQSIATARDSRKFSPPGKLIDVGGHRLHINCVGKGSPTVILEAGAGGTSLDWSRVQSELAKMTRVCAYDRAGLGWSEPGPAPRTAGRIAEELRVLLANANVEGPYVLAGHSFGGLVMRLYAARFPDEAAGLVLVDSVHEDLFSRMPPQVREANQAQLSRLSVGRFLAPIGLMRLLFPPLAAQHLPPEPQRMANALGFRSSTVGTLYNEARSFEASASQLRSSPPLASNLSLAVLTRSKPETWPSGVSANEAERVWKELQAELAGLSGANTHAIVEDAGHHIQIEQPDAVIEAIRQQVQDARR